MGAIEDYLRKRMAEDAQEDVSFDYSEDDLGAKSEDEQKNPLSYMSPSEGLSLLGNTLYEGAERELEKPASEIALDVVKFPLTAAKAIAGGIYEEGKKIVEDPRNAVGALGGIAGAALGALTGNPAAALAGGVAGRAVGEAAESWMFNRPVLNAESALEVATSGFGNMTGQLLGGQIRKGLRKAGADLAQPELAPTVIQRDLINDMTPEQQLAESEVLALRAKTDEAVRNRLTTLYKEVEAKGFTMPAYSYQSALEPGTITDRIKSMVTDDGVDFPTASRQVLADELAKRDALDEVTRITSFGEDAEKQSAIMRRELGKIDKLNTGPQPDGKLRETPKQRAVQAGLRAPRELAEFLERTNAQKLEKLPGYLDQDLDTFRAITETLPEATKHPLILAGNRIAGSGLMNSLFRTQSMLRKDGDPHLTGIGNILISADETYKGLKQHYHQKHKELFSTKLSHTDKVYQQTLESNPELFLAVKDLPDDLTDIQATAMLQARAPGTKIDSREIGDLKRNVAFMTKWQQSIGDPIVTTAYGLAKDADTVPGFGASYYTSTFTYEAELDKLRAQLVEISDLAAKSRADGSPLAERYLESEQILKNKIAVGQDAARRKAETINTWRQLTAVTGEVPKEVFAPALVGKKTMMGIGLDPEEASLSYIDSTLKKMVYDRALVTGDATIRDWVKVQTGAGKNVAGVQSVARQVQNILMDQVGTRASIQMQKIADTFDRSNVTRGLGKHVMRGMKNITTFHYLVNIAAKPAFYPMNLMQNFLTLMPLVDTESFSHGIMKGLVGYKKAFKEAEEAGALQEGMNKLWREDPLQVGQLRLDRTAEKLGAYKPAEATENWNRVVAYHAGLYNAQQAGLKGFDAVKKALDVVAETNFMYSAAHRPSAFNTPINSAVLRYRSFSQNYGSFIANLARKGEKGKLGTALAAVFATSGTTGIPMYQYVQSAAAQAGYNLPPINPMEEVMGFELGGASAPFPVVPTSVEDALGPFGGIVDAGLDTLTGANTVQGEGNAARLVRGVIGGPASKLIGGIAETARGGVTLNRSGTEMIAQRSPEQIAMTALGLSPTIGQEQYRASDRIRRGLQTRDGDAIRNAIIDSRLKGIRNQQQITQRTKADITSKERKTVIGELVGYGPRAR